MAKKKSTTEWKDQSIQELEVAVRDFDRELYALRTELSLSRKLEKPHLLKAVKKNKARVLTFLALKQRAAQSTKEV